MVSQINDAVRIKSIDPDGRLKTKQQNKHGTKVDNNASIDTVSISSTSKQLERLKASLIDISEINETLVLYFKTQLQNGNYQINNDRIARNMLNCAEMA